MTLNYIKYGAVAAKARAMYGKRVTPEELEHMAKMTSLRQVIAFLKRHPGWSGAFAGYDEREPDRARLEALMKNAAYERHLLLARYLKASDRRFYDAWMLSIEVDVALGFALKLNAGSPEEFAGSVPDSIKKHLSVDFAALASARSYEDLRAAFSRSKLAPALSAFDSGRGTADYSALELALTAFYMKNMYDIIKKGYSGRVMEKLLKSLGLRADIANISRAIRLRGFLREDEERLPEYLIPHFYKVKLETLKAVYRARGDGEIKAALSGTPYAALFSAGGAGYFEQRGFEFNFNFYKKALHGCEPSILTQLAYLELLQTEVRNLTHIIECVRYGLSGREAEKYLTGLGKSAPA